MKSRAFATHNLTKRALTVSLPWQFCPDKLPADEIRFDKQKRQEWYKSESTNWNFYTFVESVNPNQRASREDNPPKLLHGVAADFDIHIPETRVKEAIEAMVVKPAWIENSLGGNYRLLWLFPRPLPVDSYEFCSALLQQAVKWLRMDLLPGLDVPAVSDPTRLYCNGCSWTETGHGPISETILQTFFVEVGQSYRFVSKEGVEIPLDKVEKALQERYPKFTWPGDFILESSGPSFFIPESQSSNSAILKAEGFLTFSAHATKAFYFWEDILGVDFVKEFSTAAIAKATSEVWFDGRKFWRKKKGDYVGMDMAELSNFLKIDCGVKGKQLENALSHIYNENFVENASPYLFRPPGLLMYQGRRRLNTAVNAVMKPATAAQSWGESGNFPFLSTLLSNIFTSDIQKDHFLAWYKYFYETGLNSCPAPGQAIFLMGGVCTGKTFTSREVVGRSVGGYVDAASYIIKGADFNSHLFEAPLWALDDDTISDSPQAAANVQAMLKKAVANNAFLSNKKFQQAGMVEWAGRVFATTNTDYISSRMLGPLDNSALDKISVYRCQKTTKFKFPSRIEMEKLVSAELPYLLRWLVDHTPPDHVQRDTRFGFRSWHEGSLMDQASQTSKSAPFKEILIETMEEYFAGNPKVPEWRGTVSKLIQQMHANPMHECVIRTLRLEQVSRYLENVERDGAMNCRVETGALNTRIWIFPRRVTEADGANHAEVPQQVNSIFAK